MIRMEEALDCLSDSGDAGAGAFAAGLSSFFSGFAGSGSAGGPSGNAVLNRPVTSAAIVFLPEGVIWRAISSGCANWSAGVGISPDFDDVSMSGVNVSFDHLAGDAVNLHPVAHADAASAHQHEPAKEGDDK